MTSAPDNVWLPTLARMALVLAAAVALGWLAGWPRIAFALAALGLLGWQLWRLQQVLARIEARQAIGTPGRGAWGRLDRLLARDQRETRVRQRRLLDMLRAYRAAADALPDAVVVVARDHQRILWSNEAATRLLGLHHPDDVDAALVERLQPLPVAHWLAGGRNAEPLFDVPSPVDPEVRLNLRLIPYSDELWLLVARDVSKLVRLEQMRRDFVANVSHELRTPLTVIHGYLEMLDPAGNADWEPALAEMRRQSQRMTGLVEDLLTLSRLEAQDTLGEERVAMAPMLDALRREAEALSQQRHAIAIEDEARVDLLGSPRELHSAFSNLVSNAVRYTPEGGRIRVRFAREGAGAVLAVEDSGAGIPAAHQPRLTERFYRVSTSRSRESGGTGLGLAIVKHVLGLHQARLGIRSEVGRGSTFSCHFGAERVLPREAARSPA